MGRADCSVAARPRGASSMALPDWVRLLERTDRRACPADIRCHRSVTSRLIPDKPVGNASVATTDLPTVLGARVIVLLGTGAKVHPSVGRYEDVSGYAAKMSALASGAGTERRTLSLGEEREKRPGSTLPDEDREGPERDVGAQEPGSGEGGTRPGIDPAPGRQVDLERGRPGLGHRRHQQVVPEEVLERVIPDRRVVGPVEAEGLSFLPLRVSAGHIARAYVIGSPPAARSASDKTRSG